MQLPAQVSLIIDRVTTTVLEHGEKAFVSAVILLVLAGVLRFLRRWIGPFSGRYTAKFTLERVEHTERIVARQFLNRVWGTSNVQWRVGSADVTRGYRFHGKVDDHVLLARYTCTSSDMLDCGVFILRLTDHPDVRAGMYAGLSSSTLGKFVVDTHYSWTKLPN